MAAQKLTTDVLGLREAKAAFQKLPDIARDAYNDATLKTLSGIARGAAANISAHGNIRTRALLDHLGFTLNEKTGQGRVGIQAGTTLMTLGNNKRVRVKGIISAGKGGSALTSQGAKVIKPTKYGHLIEFGTGPGHTSPYMRPAVSAEQAAYLQRCRDAGKQIERDMANIGSRNL